MSAVLPVSIWLYYGTREEEHLAYRNIITFAIIIWERNIRNVDIEK